MKRVGLITGLMALMVVVTSPAEASRRLSLTPESTVTFICPHIGIGETRGTVAGATGMIVIDPDDPTQSVVEARFSIETLDTGTGWVNAHLKGDDFFDAADHPHAVFRSTAVEITGPDSARVSGLLTLRGVSRPAVLEVRYSQSEVGLTFTATGKIRRSDYDIGGSLLPVSDTIAVVIQAVAR